MNMKRAAILLTMTVCLWQLMPAQGSFWDSPDAYLGQTRPSETPTVFAPGLLADSGTFTLDRIAFSNDGKEIYYEQDDRWFSTKHAKIKVVKYADHKWRSPTVLNEHYYAPTFSVDGDTLYFMGDRANQVWQSHRTTDGWSIPTLFLEKAYGLYDFMPTNGGRFYVGSDAGQGKLSDWNTYKFSVLEVSGGATTIRSLGSPLNEPGFNGDFFIARDESFMIVSAKERPHF